MALLYARCVIELCASWLEAKRWRWRRSWREINLQMKPMFCRHWSERVADTDCCRHPDSDAGISILNNPGAVMILLYASHDLLLHLLLFHRSLRRQRALGETLKKLKNSNCCFVLFVFLLFINCFKKWWNQLISFPTWSCWQCDIPSP